MKQRDQREPLGEAVGIVISAGQRGDVTPRFAAFVWGPAPEPVPDEVGLEAQAA